MLLRTIDNSSYLKWLNRWAEIMCIIIDANCSHRMTGNSCENGLFLLEKISAGKIKIVSGGRNKTELVGTKFKAMYQQLRLAGRLIEKDDIACRNEEQQVTAGFALKSDDPHIIALARISGCRLLFSYDDNACDDFKDNALLRKPPGKIFRSRDQVHLLSRAPSCR